MSQTLTYGSSKTSNSVFLSELAGFYRRWFAIETVPNASALDEIGLSHLISSR